MFTDPPYNVAIDGNVCGLGQIRHREFAMASGEMSVGQFTDFLASALASMVRHLRSGMILYVCMHWRHMRELCEAGEICGLELKNLVVWNKTNGGMGAYYRSKHELIFVFNLGDAAHVNSFGLGESKHGMPSDDNPVYGTFTLTMQIVANEPPAGRDQNGPVQRQPLGK